jgi:hypothetical protein
MPVVDGRLQGVAALQQGVRRRHQFVADVGQRLPKGGGRDAGPRRDLVANQVMEGGGDLQAADGDALGHGSCAPSSGDGDGYRRENF